MKRLIVLGFLISITAFKSANAQLWYFQNQYFQNQYLSNPAMIGSRSDINIDMNYTNQMMGMPGAPKIFLGAADMSIFDNSNIGAQFYQNTYGAWGNSQLKMGYAYSLQFEDDSRLRMGLNLGGFMGQIRAGELTKNDNTNVSNISFTNLSADFGLAYLTDRFTLQIAVPNVSRANNNYTNVALASKFYGSFSYDIQVSGGLVASPLIAYRNTTYGAVKGAGVQTWLLDRTLSISGMYHYLDKTASNLSLGMSYFHESNININFYYTAQLGTLSSAQMGGLEIGLGYRIQSRQ